MTIFNELKLGLTDEQVAVLELVSELEQERDDLSERANYWLSARVKYAKLYRESGEEDHKQQRDHADDVFHEYEELSNKATERMNELAKYYRSL